MREVLLRLVAILEQQQQSSYEEVDDEDNHGNDRRICLFEMQITLHRRAARRLGRTPANLPRAPSRRRAIQHLLAKQRRQQQDKYWPYQRSAAAAALSSSVCGVVNVSTRRITRRGFVRIFVNDDN